MRMALRVGLLSLLVTLVLGALGGGALAGKNLFDADYRDCPASTRLAALTGVRVVRTDKDSELQVEWDTPNPSAWQLGGYTAAITVIVDASGVDPQEHNLALGASRVLFKGIDTAREWDVQVAVTDRKYVISDIVETTFISGVKKPQFYADFMLGDKDIGNFYYLGYSHVFDNWYVDNGLSFPKSPKFRVGLRHSTANPADAKFDHFRIRVEDEDGDNVLGFDAATIADAIYDKQVFVLGWADYDTFYNDPARANRVTAVSNIRQSNRFEPAVPAAHETTSEVGYMWSTSGYSPEIGSFTRLSWVYQASEVVKDHRLYAETPEGVYDLPEDIFERDGTYTLQAWAEDEDNAPISPRVEITFSVQEQFDAAATTNFGQSDVVGHYSAVRIPDPANTTGGGYRNYYAFDPSQIPATHGIYPATAETPDVALTTPVLWIQRNDDDNGFTDPVVSSIIKAGEATPVQIIRKGSTGARSTDVVTIALTDFDTTGAVEAFRISIDGETYELKSLEGLRARHYFPPHGPTAYPAKVLGLTILE